MGSKGSVNRGRNNLACSIE